MKERKEGVHHIPLDHRCVKEADSLLDKSGVDRLLDFLPCPLLPGPSCCGCKLASAGELFAAAFG